MKKIFSILFVIFLIIPGTSYAAKWTLKYAHVGPATAVSDDHIPGLWLKTYLESRTGGDIAVEIYPAAQLGNFRELIEQVNQNTLELTHTTVGGMASFFPEFQVTDIPYMLANDAIAEQVAKGDWMWNVIGGEVLKRTGNVRMVAIGNTGRWRSFYTTKKLIKTAADMKGVKMRTINSPLQIEFIKAMGGNPTPVAWGEVYTSLKSGVIEGTKNAATDIIPNNMHEVCKFVSLDEHADLYGFYWMSDTWLKSLPENYQNLVVEGVRQMAEIQSNWNKQYENQALTEFAASGGTIYVPTPEEKATFLPYRDIMADWFIEQYGPEYVEGWRGAIAQAEKEVAALNAQVLQ